jgi:hypothetical protein
MQLLSQASPGVERYLYNQNPHHPGESPPIVEFFGNKCVSDTPFQILSHPKNFMVKCCVFNLSRVIDENNIDIGEWNSSKMLIDRVLKNYRGAQ